MRDDIIGYIWSAFSVPLCVPCAKSKRLDQDSDSIWNQPIRQADRPMKCDGCGKAL